MVKKRTPAGAGKVAVGAGKPTPKSGGEKTKSPQVSAEELALREKYGLKNTPEKLKTYSERKGKVGFFSQKYAPGKEA